MRLLVTGGSGFLGRELCRRAAARGDEVVGTFLAHEPETAGWRALRLDVRDRPAVEEIVGELRPHVVLHTAYRQAGEGAEETVVAGSDAVARAAADGACRLVHVSTDVVFDGERPGLWSEDDEPRALTPYGRWKREAERRVLAAHPEALAVRTSLILGGDRDVARSPHEELALAAAAGRADAVFFTDELRSPVAVRDLADALLELAGGGAAGVLHVAGADHVSRHELACLVASAHGLDPARIRAGTSRASGLVRPRNCALDSSRARALLRTRLRGARELFAPQGASRSSRQPASARV